MLQKSFQARISDETQLWENEGILTAEQRSAILRRYEKPLHSDAVREMPMFIRVLYVLAALLIGLAAFLLISFNWNGLPGAVKLSIVGITLFVSYAAGFTLRIKGGKNWSEAVFFFASLMFGVAIWQIGQVFHLPADYPQGLLIWASGVFLMAIVLGGTPLHLLSVALLALWVGASVFGMKPFWMFGFFQFAPIATPALPLFVLVGIASGIIRKNTLVPAFYVVLFLFWWIMIGVSWQIGNGLAFHVAATGFICIVASDLFSRRTAISLWQLGCLLVLGGLLVPSFSHYWTGLFRHGNLAFYGRGASPSPVWQFVLPLVNFAFIFLLSFYRWNEPMLLRIRKNSFVPVMFGNIAFLWVVPLFISLFTATQGGGYYGYRNEFPGMLPIAFTLVTNFQMLVFMILMIQTGLKRENAEIFWSGIIYFLIWTIIRYVDLFSGFGGMLGAAAVFFFCACVLLGIAYFWTSRMKRHLALPKTEEKDESPLPISVWLETLCNKMSPFFVTERIVLIGGICVVMLQFGVLGAMIRNEMIPHVSGTTISVSPIPVDPRDLFRGDYVILRYPFSRTNELPNPIVGQTVYVSMRQDGDLWVSNGISRTKPTDGVFIRGKIKHAPAGSIEIVYGIESYFVQEGKGREIERAMRSGNNSGVVVDLVVAPSGKASVKTLRAK